MVDFHCLSGVICSYWTSISISFIFMYPTIVHAHVKNISLSLLFLRTPMKASPDKYVHRIDLLLLPNTSYKPVPAVEYRSIRADNLAGVGLLNLEVRDWNNSKIFLMHNYARPSYHPTFNETIHCLALLT